MRFWLTHLAALLLLFAAADAFAADPAVLPDTTLLIHKNGSITVTVDGQEHLLPPREFRKQVGKLLEGKPAIALTMEDWGDFERMNLLGGPFLYDVGVRSITLRIFIDGMEQVRTFEINPPSLKEQIRSRDPAIRKAALDKLEEMLNSKDEGFRLNAVIALSESQSVRFDRSRFLPHVRPLLSSTDEYMLQAAFGTIAAVGGDETDIPAVLAHLDDQSLRTRASISTTLYNLNPEGDHASVGPAIEKLLNDPDESVRIATAKSLWGLPTTPQVEAKLIEISRGPEGGGSSEADIAIYYALSTRPLNRKPVVERLIEIMWSQPSHQSRAAWGLSHHRADDDAQPLLVDALIEVIDKVVDRGMREDAAYALGYHGGDKALEKLERLALDPNESSYMRDYARQQLPQDRRDALANKTAAAPDKSEPAELAPFEPPAELWQRIEQTRDLKLREKALSDVETLLHGDEEETIEGLNVLLKVHEASFDRESFVFLVERLLYSSNKTVQALAIAAMTTMGPKAIKPSSLADYVDNESDVVRQAVAESIFRVDPDAKDESTMPALEKLLADANPEVALSMIRAVASKPSSPAADELIVDLTYHGALGNDAIYYALSTRPLVRQPVAERLIELVYSSEENRSRAIWGLSSYPIADDARDLVTNALIEIVDNTVDNNDRWQAIVGLARIATPAAKTRLQQILDSADESDEVKQHVREQLPKQ